jgi:hypothetical protein
VPPRSEPGTPRQRQEEERTRLFLFGCASPLFLVRAAPFRRASDAGPEEADSVDFFYVKKDDLRWNFDGAMWRNGPDTVHVAPICSPRHMVPALFFL